jgi:hypothetical protein
MSHDENKIRAKIKTFTACENKNSLLIFILLAVFRRIMRLGNITLDDA